MYSKHFCNRKWQKRKNHNDNPLLGENDRGSNHYSSSSTFHPEDVWIPWGFWRLISILLFLFFISLSYRMKLLSCKVAWLKNSSLAHPPQSPEAVAPSTGRSRSLWHPTSHAKGRGLLAVGRSHHSPMTRPLWCPLDGMSVTYGGKSISHVLRELGYVCLLDFVIHLHVEDTLERDYNFPITIS